MTTAGEAALTHHYTFRRRMRRRRWWLAAVLNDVLRRDELLEDLPHLIELRETSRDYLLIDDGLDDFLTQPPRSLREVRIVAGGNDRVPRVAVVARRRWYGLCIDVDASAPFEPVARGYNATLAARLGWRAIWHEARRRRRAWRHLMLNPWFVGLALLVLGLLVAPFVPE